MWKKIIVFGIVITLLSIVFAAGSRMTYPNETRNQIGLQQEEQEAPDEAVNYNAFSYFFKVLLMIGFGGLLVALFIGIKKGAFLGNNQSGVTAISVRAVKGLGPRKSLYFVEALGRVLLLGVTDSQISVLMERPVDELSPDEQAMLTPAKGTNTKFAKLLKQLQK